MGSHLTILDRLLAQADTSESKEHVLEQASFAVDNVLQRFLGKFDTLVAEISGEIGSAPEFNASTDASEGSKNPMPNWVTGNKVGDASRKVLRLSYWKREGGISYAILRTELDSKDRPKYYDLVLGGRKRTKSDSAKIAKMRATDTSFWGWLKRMVGSKSG